MWNTQQIVLQESNRSTDVHGGIEHRKREQQAEDDVWSQLRAGRSESCGRRGSNDGRKGSFLVHVFLLRLVEVQHEVYRERETSQKKL